jgi:hypothetical protein
MSAALDAFFAEPLLAVIGTKRRDGSVALNPVWFEHRNGAFWLNSYEASGWPRRLQREGAATLLVIDPADSLRFAQVQCELLDVIREGAREHIDQLSRRYLGDVYRGPNQERLIVRLRPTRIVSEIR